MAAENPGSTATRPAQAGWRPWLRVAGIAAALLVLSEALWLWQTWPVRELVHSGAAPTPTRHP